MTIRVVDENSINIVAPYGLSDELIKKILLEKNKWIEKKISERKSVKEDHPDVFGKKSILIAGEECKISFGDVPNICCIDGKIILPLAKRDSEGSVDRELSRFVLNLAKNRLPKLVAFWGSKMSLCPTSIKVKQLKSKWGSCNGDGEIVLNSRLVQLPPLIAEYVVVHELCHLKNLNHSEAFWQSVQFFLPDYAKRRSDLKKYDFLMII